MDRLRALEVFIAIAEQGSLTAAARELGTSLPSVVRTLAAYEQRLGVRLFQRTTRRITLTDEGHRHLAHAREILDKLRAAEAELAQDVAQPQGHLTLTAPVLFGQLYVAPAVTRFVAAHPQLRCSVLLLDRVVNLLEEGIDVGIRIGRLDDSSLIAQPLGFIRRVVVASPAYLRRHRAPHHPRELAQHNCVRMLGGPADWAGFQEGGRALRVPVQGNLAFNQVFPAAARTRAFIDWVRQEITAFRD